MLMKYLKELSGNIAKIPFIGFLVAVAIYFWINGAAHFPNWDTSYSAVTQVYLVMMVVFWIWAKDRTEKIVEKKPIGNSMTAFFGAFLITVLITQVLVAIGALTSGAFPADLFWQTVIMQVCVVAATEELIFRGIILEHLGIIASSFTFAIFHSFAYGVQWYNLLGSSSGYISLIFAFLFGVLMCTIVRRANLGLPASIGAHAAYNLVILGAISI